MTDDVVVFAGKLNMLDELVQPFGAGRGVDAFRNTNLVFPVVLERTVPYSTLGGRFAVMSGKRGVFTLVAFDTHNTTTTAVFVSFFTNGAVVLSKLDIPVSFFGLPGHQGVEGTYSTGTYDSLRTIPYFDVNGIPSVTFGTVRGSWSVFYVADQALYVESDPRPAGPVAGRRPHAPSRSAADRHGPRSRRPRQDQFLIGHASAAREMLNLRFSRCKNAIDFAGCFAMA